MPLFRVSLPFVSAIAISVSLIPAAVWSQGVSANELWARWQEGVANRGGSLTAEVSREGNRLVLSEVHFEPVLEAGIIEIEKVDLVNQADGSVAVILPETFPLVVGMPAVAGSDERHEVLLSVSAPKMNLIVRGLGDRADFQADAPEINVIFDKFIPEVAADAVKTKMSSSVKGMSFRFQQDLSLAVPIVNAALSYDSFDGVITLESESEGATTGQNRSARIEGFKGTLSGAFPASFAPLWGALTGAESEGAGEQVSPDAGAEAAALGALAERRISLLTALKDGLKLSLDITHGPVSYVSGWTGGPDWGMQQDFALLDGTSKLSMDQTALAVDLLANGMLLANKSVIDDAVGREQQARLSEFRLASKIGVNDLAAPQDWSFSTNLRDLNLSPETWANFDPSQIIPQDPLSFGVNLAGQYSIRPEALSGEDWRALGKVPFNLLTISMQDLLLSALGVEATGAGDLAFDFETQPQNPLPLGALNFAIKGVNAVLDRLGSASLLSPDDLRGLRLQLAALTRAGEGEDHLLTDVDFKEGGIFLNGQKVY